MATYKIKEPVIYMKSIARSIGKAIANEALNKEIDKQTGGGIFGDISRFITSEALGATENADLRVTHYFPAIALIGCVELDEGVYNIQINYIDKNNNVMYSKYYYDFVVRKYSGKNLIESICLH